MLVKTRFAPSPTGYLHVGCVRTALFSWLFARANQGKFVLRIEDTDRERSTQESVSAILSGMEWLGIDYDEGPIYQTDRYQRYLQVIDELEEKDLAYRCNCSKERLAQLREDQLARREKPRYDGLCRDKNLPKSPDCVVRFRNPDTGTVSFKDEVYGDIHVANNELDDLIILRSDGNPTYNFAVVVDDLDMQITHVIRGDDHINNTPRQINLFKALHADIPTFAHLPMILGPDGKRLSKRHGAVSVLQFREAGILPHALLNYLVRLGWSYGDQEIFSIEDMIAKFNLKNVSRAAASFNHDKLTWLNQHYQKNDPKELVAKALLWHFETQGIDPQNGPKLEDLVEAQAERCKNLAEMCSLSLYFYKDSIQYDEKLVEKLFTSDALRLLGLLLVKLQSVDIWEKDKLQTCINDLVIAEGIGFAKLAQPLRLAVTGGNVSPSIDLTLFLLGREKVIKRLSAVCSQT